MCRSMVDIQSATAEIRRGKKEEEERQKPQLQNIVSAYATEGGHKNEMSSASFDRFLSSPFVVSKYLPLPQIFPP